MALLSPLYRLSLWSACGKEERWSLLGLAATGNVLGWEGETFLPGYFHLKSQLSLAPEYRVTGIMQEKLRNDKGLPGPCCEVKVPLPPTPAIRKAVINSHCEFSKVKHRCIQLSAVCGFRKGQSLSHLARITQK